MKEEFQKNVLLNLIIKKIFQWFIPDLFLVYFESFKSIDHLFGQKSILKWFN